MNNDEHPLDQPLGTIHEVAIQLAMRGLHDLAVLVAQAHEEIQNWAIRNDEYKALWEACERLRNPLYRPTSTVMSE